MKRIRKFWTDAEIWRLIALHPDMSNAKLAKRFKRTYSSIIGMAGTLGLEKSHEYTSSLPFKSGMVQAGAKFRFPKGHIPANKGLRRPGFHAGRMRETQFKKGQFPPNRDLDFYVIGALRVNADGYLDMRTSFRPGALGWTALHRILWEDVHGPLPKGCCLRFRDGDCLNVEITNLERLSRADNMRRNSIHRLPQALKSAIQLFGQLKRRINEKQDHRSA